MSMLGIAGLIASWIIAAVFVAAAVAKLADQSGTRTAVGEFGSPASLSGMLALGIPLAELVVAALLLYGPSRTLGGAGAIGLLLIFSIAIAVRLAQGKAPDCHCFGQMHAAPVSWKTLVRNGVLAGFAGTGFAAGFAGETPSALPWIRGLSGTGLLALSLGGALAVLTIAGGMAFVSLLRSYGKVLLKVDEFGRRLAAAGLAMEEREEPPKIGHAPGTIAPAFTALGEAGETVSLVDLLEPGLPVLLVFSSPTCEPCKLLRPDIAAWQAEHIDRLTIAVVDADPNLSVHEAYRAGSTPSAVLVAPDGTIASYLAPGSRWIKDLVESAVAPKSEERGLPVGSPVPELTVPGLDGEPVSLTREGQETLVLFWNPGCGYCHSMREDLLAWEQRAPAGAPRLLIVSSGDEASTRAEGFASTVALDPGFSAGATFGAGGTPMAILVDSRGRVASPLAAGAEAVFALAGGRGSTHG